MHSRSFESHDVDWGYIFLTRPLIDPMMILLAFPVLLSFPYRKARYRIT